MLHFLRRIRRGLINTGATRMYLLYAIGEILLVMVGILLALQVNNWNENSKNHKSEMNYLKGIVDDLQADASYMSSIIVDFEEKSSKFKLLDSLTRNDIMNESHLDEFRPHWSLIVAPQTFFPTSGAYNSMISEGKSELIKNRVLLNKVQTIYNIDYTRLVKIADRIDQHSGQVAWELRKDRFEKHPESKFLDKNKVTDIMSGVGLRTHYKNRLFHTKENIEEVINLIKIELKK